MAKHQKKKYYTSNLEKLNQKKAVTITTATFSTAHRHATAKSDHLPLSRLATVRFAKKLLEMHAGNSC